MRRFTLGICAMETKAKSPPMTAILQRLESNNDFQIIIFPEEMILHGDIDTWPRVDCLIAFHSNGFPLSKAIEYVDKYKPIILNSLVKQTLFRSRHRVYQELKKCKIPHPNYIVIDHEAVKRGEHTFEEHPNYIIFDNIRLNKPFIEKPINAEDHNNWIYYPMNAGGGCKKLFRKVHDRSSEYCPDLHTVRRDSVYLYEEFMSTFGTDIKVYTVGQMFAHAEARRAPTLDGRVWRTPEGKEVRYPVILTEVEKIIAYRVVSHFEQTVCGFDILRTTNGPYVCDINGWSFVKGNKKYYRDCSHILRIMFLLKLEEKYQIIFRNVIPPSFVAQETEEVFRRTFGEDMNNFHKSDDTEELCSVIVVMRHGDRKPKQKLKFYSRAPQLLDYFNDKKYSPNTTIHCTDLNCTSGELGGCNRKQIKLKSPEEMKIILGVNEEILEELTKEPNKYDIESCDIGGVEPLSALQNHKLLDRVLKIGDGFTGINRKIQLKSVACDGKYVTRVLIIAKWGGELTGVGRRQAEDLGKRLRASLYPGDATGLIRLHSTYRHDLKIYTSDEGRCQITSAAFTKGILDLEGELPPILVSMTLRNEKSYSLLNDSVSVTERSDCKKRLQKLLKLRSKIKDPNPDEMDSILSSVDLNPNDKPHYLNALGGMNTLGLTLGVVKNFLRALNEELAHFKSVENNSYIVDVLNEIKSRWRHILIKWKDGNDFDFLGIPDIVDNLRFDLIHHHAYLGKALGTLFTIYNTVKDLNNIISPCEYGVTPEEKLTIGTKVVKRLLIKILHDVTLVKDMTNERTAKSSQIIYPTRELCRNRDLLYASLVAPVSVEFKGFKTPSKGGVLSSNDSDTKQSENLAAVSVVAAASASAASIAATALAISSLEEDDTTVGDNPITSIVGGLKPSDMFTTSSKDSRHLPKEDRGTMLLNSSKMWVHQGKPLEEDLISPFSLNTESRSDDEHSVRLLVNQARELGIRSPYRMVRSRYYVTSASYMFSLLNIFVHAKDSDGEGIFDDIHCAGNLSCITDMHYLSHIVLRVWERKGGAKETSGITDNYRLEILVSSGAKDGFGQNYELLTRSYELMGGVKHDIRGADSEEPFDDVQDLHSYDFMNEEQITTQVGSLLPQPGPDLTCNPSPSVKSKDSASSYIDNDAEGPNKPSEKGVPPYCELSPLVTLTLDCPLNRFENIISRLVQSN